MKENLDKYFGSAHLQIFIAEIEWSDYVKCAEHKFI